MTDDQLMRLNRCDCDGIGWTTGCRHGGRECVCGYECCNKGRYADDGGGYEDFVIGESICACEVDT